MDKEESGLWLPTLPTVSFTGKYSGDYDVGRHTHECAEMVLVTEGRCATLVGGDWLSTSCGDLLMQPANVSQTQKAEGFARTTFIGFHALPALFDVSPRVVTLGADAFIASWVEQVHALHRPPEENQQITASSLLMTLLHRINAVESRQSFERRLHPDLSRAIRFIEDSFALTITVAEIADRAHLSASHLTALCRETFSCGPLKYQQRLRLMTAKRLLRNPYVSVSEVALICGYVDTNYFIRLFRKETGKTPGQWRKDG